MPQNIFDLSQYKSAGGKVKHKLFISVILCKTIPRRIYFGVPCLVNNSSQPLPKKTFLCSFDVRWFCVPVKLVDVDADIENQIALYISGKGPVSILERCSSKFSGQVISPFRFSCNFLLYILRNALVRSISRKPQLWSVAVEYVHGLISIG